MSVGMYGCLSCTGSVMAGDLSRMYSASPSVTADHNPVRLEKECIN